MWYTLHSGAEKNIQMNMQMPAKKRQRRSCMRKPNPNEIYRHFKGNLYKVMTLAKHTETGEEMVVYEALYGGHEAYARPLSMFMSPVDKEKYPQSEQDNRFELVNEVEAEDDLKLDPLVLEFLDADTYEQRLNILAALHHRITDDMINIMAVAADVEVAEGELEERYAALRTCLLTLDKYECSRLR